MLLCVCLGDLFYLQDDTCVLRMLAPLAIYSVHVEEHVTGNYWYRLFLYLRPCFIKKKKFSLPASVFQALTVRWDTLSCLHFRNWESRRPSGWLSLEMFSANLGSSHSGIHSSSWLFSSSTLTSWQPHRIASGWTHFSWTPLKIKIWWQNWFK